MESGLRVAYRDRPLQVAPELGEDPALPVGQRKQLTNRPWMPSTARSIRESREGQGGSFERQPWRPGAVHGDKGPIVMAAVLDQDPQRRLE